MDAVNLLELEAMAQRRLPKAAFDYIGGGAEDEITLAENRRAFARIALRPRVLQDVAAVDTATVILGQRVSLPVVAAPAGFQRMFHPEGELAAARGVRDAGTLLVLSTVSSASLEEVAGVAGPRWFQLYCARDRDVTAELLRRAEAAGYTAVCLTVDLARVGRRERDLRNRAEVPPEAMPGNFRSWLHLDAAPEAERGPLIERFVGDLLVSSLTWADVEWIRSVTRLPLLLKGVLTAEDGALAVEHGVDGVVVSNHGGRQLDGSVAAVAALPEVVAAVAGRVPVLMDGGVRRGTDVVKALALGAQAVMIGRPYLWGLALDGAAGVTRVFEMLRRELEIALPLVGCATPTAVTSDHVARH